MPDHDWEETDEFQDYLDEQMKRPNFRRYYQRAERRAAAGHTVPLAIKPNLRRRGWRRSQ